jgi:hypothetical protein
MYKPERYEAPADAVPPSGMALEIDAEMEAPAVLPRVPERDAANTDRELIDDRIRGQQTGVIAQIADVVPRHQYGIARKREPPRTARH